MIREWMTSDGLIKRIDTVTKTVFSVNSAGEVVDHVRPATEDELAEFYMLFPTATQEELVAKNGMNAELSELLNELREITSDNQISPQEFYGVAPKVQLVLKDYSAFGYKDANIDRLAFLVITQVSFAYSLLLAGASANSQQMLQSLIVLNRRMDEVEFRLSALEA
jgi:hypothetical protein